jgi:hypothetical protein
MPTTQVHPLGVMPPVSVLNHRGDHRSRSPASRSSVTARLRTAGQATSLSVLTPGADVPSATG